MGSLQQLSIAKGSQTKIPSGLLHKIFEQRVIRDSGSQTATVFNDAATGESRKMSYDCLNALTNRLARTIVQEMKAMDRAYPNQDGDFIVAVCMAPSDYLVATLLAIWKAGAAYLPLDVSFPTNRIQHILKESNPILIIHDDDYENADAFGQTASMSLGKLRKLSAENNIGNLGLEQTLSKRQTDDVIAIVLYTSGSTGIPKGVRLPHSIVMNRLVWQWSRFPYSSTEVNGIFKTALTFVDHVSEIWGPLLNAMTVIVVPRDITKNPEMLIPLLEQYQIERLVLVPTLLRSILLFLHLRDDQTVNPLRHLKLWVCSGETLSVQLAKEFFDHFPEGGYMLANFYGSTEVMGDVTYFVCESKKQLDNLAKIPIGIAIDNTLIYLLNGEQQPVKLGEIGEIFVSGLNLAAGYVNKRDPERFIDNPLSFDPNYNRLYRTGDYGSIQKGIIFYEGRTDSQIKIRGYRVDLTEIEKQVLSISYVEKAIVLCYHAGEADQALLSFVALNEEMRDKVNEFQIEAKLQSLLPSYMVPQVVVMDQIPLLVNGKIDRQSLLKSYESCNNNEEAEIYVDIDYSGVPKDQMSAAKDLFEVVGNVIGRSTRATINVQSNFYELGGNSLNSIMTVAELKDKGYHISVTDFITAKNLGHVLSKIIQSGSESYLSQIDDDFQTQLTSCELVSEERDEDVEIVRICFYEKADLEKYVQPPIQKDDYDCVLLPIWDVLIKEKLAFSVKDDKSRTVGICLSFDAHNEPEVEVTNNLSIIFGFLEHLEGPIRTTKLPQGTGKVIHNFMMATVEDLTAPQNVAVINFMEHEVINVAKRKGFETVFTTNTNPLTQQLATTVYGYKTLLGYQVNKYVAPDGSRPFATAPDSQTALVQSKAI